MASNTAAGTAEGAMARLLTGGRYGCVLDRLEFADLTAAPALNGAHPSSTRQRFRVRLQTARDHV